MRVLHFVTGGFSGATQVAVDLCLATLGTSDQALLVLRRKRNTDAARVQALRDQGLDVRVVPGWSHLATVLALRKIALEWQPDILVAHGFSDHLWGRYAGILAGVPHMVHIEHNARERYTAARMAQARWLNQRTDAIVGVSEGVRNALLSYGFPPEKCFAINNGVDLQRFPIAQQVPWSKREPAIVMAARFARQKDHACLIQALAPLRDQHGLTPTLYLAGGGKKRVLQQCRQLVNKLGLQQQVQFLGHVPDLPQLLMRTQINVLATHFEGMPLSLVEGMVAGCACIGSNVIGVQQAVQHGKTGLLVPESDSQALSDALKQLLTQPAYAQQLANTGQEQARKTFARTRMQADYRTLFARIMQASD